RLLEKDRRWRRLGDERERTVGVRGDEHRDDQVTHLLRARVELLAELHDVQPVLSERRPHGRCGVRLTGGALELDDCGDLLHDNSLVSAAQSGRARTYAFSTWAKSSSTDVVRPNIDSETLSFCLSAFTSSTFAEKLANGPSTTRTFSPGSND